MSTKSKKLAAERENLALLQGEHPMVPLDVDARAVAGVIAEEAAKAGVQAADLTSEAIQMSVLKPMAEEGRKIVAEGIAESPTAIDLVEVLGFGFPRWRGGLMHWAETAGIDF